MIKLITIFILLPVILLSQKFNKFRVGDNHYKISNIEYLSLGGQHNDIIVNIYVDSLPNNIKTKISVQLPLTLKVEKQIITIYFVGGESITLEELERNVSFNNLNYVLSENQTMIFKNKDVEKISLSDFGTYHLKNKSYFKNFINSIEEKITINYGNKNAK
jgi:hypothetical protein